MTQYLDRIRIGDTAAVISKVYDDTKVEVVYSSGVHDVYEDAHLVEGKWDFVNPEVSAGYTRGKQRLEEAVEKLNRSPELRSRLEGK